MYLAEFPDTQASGQGSLPNAVLAADETNAGEYTPASVKASSTIESEEEYQANLFFILGAEGFCRGIC